MFVIDFPNEETAVVPYTAFAQETRRPAEGTGEPARQWVDNYWSLYRNGLDAVMTFAGQDPRPLEDAGRAYFDACGNATTAMTAIGREALSCREPEDAIALQKKAMDGFDTFVSTASHFYGAMFGAYAQAINPMLLAAIARPERAFRAFGD